MTKQDSLQVAAGIVIYHPNLDALQRLVRSLIPQVSSIFIFNNGGLSTDEIHNLERLGGIEILGTGDNLGIARALNLLATVAQNRTLDYLITFDQDSLPPIGMVMSLSKTLTSLQAQGVRAAAVGPTIVDQRNGMFTFPVFKPGRLWIQKQALTLQKQDPISTILLITSGMLLDLHAFHEIGPFRENYFIDYVDTEWCLRGISLGFTFYICPQIHMNHELSGDSPKRILGRLVLKYSPIRRYYSFRNACFLLREPHCPGYMKFYLLITLIYRFFLNLIVDFERARSFQAMLNGLYDGVIKRGGEFPHK